MEDWRKFLENERSHAAITAIEEHFLRRGIKEPSLKQIKSVSKSDLLNMVLSIPTIKEIELLPQKIE